MSTRKSTAPVSGKVENASHAISTPKEKEKDKDNATLSSNSVDEVDRASVGSAETTAIISTKCDSESSAQKETSKSGNSSSSNNSNSNSRVTRNSPLLTVSPTTKKDVLGVDSEPTNSESEDGGGSATKKQIRGRKSIKDAKEASLKEAAKEEGNKSSDESKETKENHEVLSIDKDKVSKEKDVEKDIKITKESKEKDLKDCKDANEPEKEKYSADSLPIEKEKEKENAQSNLKKSSEKDSREVKDMETKDSKENKEKDNKETTEKDSKDSKDPKDLKDAVGTSNRLTRNSAAIEIASKTRVTRNRQSSAGASSRPETPTNRRGRGGGARKVVETVASQKRKRSVEDTAESPLHKVIKLEPKDHGETAEDIEDMDSNLTSSGNIDLDAVKVKQELIESDDASSTTTTDAVITPTSTSATISSSARGRGGGRWPGRKPLQTASPSTRSTRQSKGTSPASSISSTSSVREPKKRRMGGATVKRCSSASLLKTSCANNGPDEDSKDSMASLMDDILLTDIKQEKLASDIDESADVDMEVKPLEDDVTTLSESSAANGVDEPLTIETATPISTTDVEAVVEGDTTTSAEASETNASADPSNSSNKDASLSPELVSEGVSEMSVKQFYNKPKFLENNLGIEEDPKLGEIVQKATTEMDASAPEDKEATPAVDAKVTENEESCSAMEDVIENEQNVSAESLKAGDLLLEESNDGRKTPENENIESPSDQPSDDKEIEKNTKDDNKNGTDTDQVDDELVSQENSTSDEPKEGEEEPLAEQLVIDEEEGDDDDMTAEESETISMDNNPSLHDDAPEEEHDAEDDSVDELLDEINEMVEKGSIIDKIIDEGTKQTSNECDIQKAKLQKEKEDQKQKGKQVHDDDNSKGTEDDVGKAIPMDEKQPELKENNEDKSDILQKNETNEQEGSVLILDPPTVVDEKCEVEVDVQELQMDTSPIPEKMQLDENKDSFDLKAVKLTDKMMLDIDQTIEDTDMKVEKMDVDDEVLDEKDEKINETISSLLPIEPKLDELNTHSSNSNSPAKCSNHDDDDCKDEDAQSIKSTQSTDANSWATIEQDNEIDDEEKLRQKEQHLQNLGLLTLKAAEKRRQDIIQNAVEASRVAAVNQHHSKRNSNKSATAPAISNSASVTPHEYTGTLKTVIKLNRNSSGASMSGTAAAMTATNNGRKANISNTRETTSGARRQSLKMTFQKGRGRGHHAVHSNERSNNSCSGAHGADHNAQTEDSYYTIQNENEGAHRTTSGSSLATSTAGTKDQQLQKQQNINNSSNVQTHGRKSYNSRSNTTASYHHHYQNHHFTTSSSHIDSSHSEGQTESTTHHTSTQPSIGVTGSHTKGDREEILIPEKASSFKFHPGRLCEDQCYYCSGKFGLYDTPCHVGQIKSVERQQKILKNEEKLTVDNCLCDACFRHVDRRANAPSYKKRLSAPGQLENAGPNADGTNEDGTAAGADEPEVARKCVVPDCEHPASHSLRRKCIRKSVKKFLLNFDMPTGSPYIWLCQSHYDTVIQCSGCVLCKRRLGKNHMYHITSDTERLEKALTDMGIPVQLGIGTAVCKLCRYFANLLMKPPDSTKSQKAEFVKNYRKRLLQFHNIHDGSNDASEADEDDPTVSNATTSGKASKTAQARSTQNRVEINSNSPTVSSDNGGDNASDIPLMESRGGKSQQGSHAALAEEDGDGLLNFGTSVQNSNGETSNENSKSPSLSPTLSTEDGKQSSRLKAILQSGGKSKKGAANSDLPSALLRSNPNLSMRELFPGEEDLGLNFKAPFGSSNSQRTPEGWTRVQTFLQYDEPTRRLWEELQKPYGNQSSFLRHLILLEKYYRNGDLVLSPNASSNASVYTQTVRQRLSSYDHGHCGGLLSAGMDETKSAPTPPLADKEKNKDREKEKEKGKNIPLVEINDDEDEEQKDCTNRETIADEQCDEDVVMQKIPPNEEKSSLKRRTRSLSVDKLTKQLSTNAVTIIARPKESAAAATATATTSKNSDLGAQKRNEMPKLQPATIQAVHSNSSKMGSLTPLSIASSAALNSMAANASSSNSRSILKSNLLGIGSDKAIEILPVAGQKSSAASNSGNTASATAAEGSTKQQKILDVANKLLGNQMEAAAAAASAKQQHASLLTSPPELVSLQRRPQAASSSVNTAALSALTSTASATTASLINAKRPHLMQGRQMSQNRNTGPPPNVVILPDSLSPHERAESKSWRPTLMSVEENQHLLSKNGPLYQTADGRRLPGLVQVQSGGKPFLISIFDYNRMCILRREKLLRDQMLKAGKHSRSHQHQQRSSQQNANYNKMNSSGNGGNGSGSSNSGAGSSSSSNNSTSKQAQVAKAQHQLMQLLQYQKHQQQQQQQQAAALKAATAASNSTATTGRYHPIAPKPSSLATNTAAGANMMSNSGNSIGNNNNLNNVNANNTANNRHSTSQSTFPMPLLANALSNAAAAAAAANQNVGSGATMNNAPWLWSNFPDAHELLRNGAQGLPNKLPPLLPKPNSTMSSSSAANSLLPPTSLTSKQLQHQQMLLDNTLMSKIPKSLTVIPQHKLMGNNNNSAGKE